MVGVSTYVTVDWLDTPPTLVICNGYVPIVDAGRIVDIIVSVNDVIANGYDPNVKANGIWDVL